ncbi:NADPH-dependent FMN reductase [Streptomyces litchfieldiae]|uniref:NAD(P)H-dependent oxidoreductase n=1 Tax=Streptomyces litchfieldiae TaxID=3075543 RepID=A0ABU2MVV6_9ACTN|nr:NAD(P)H-dependent oxidoreductase [Streptomyces sp. DSM 44938]MDT0344978.1 NAD(P)H-dependent oxidoreductase [Streptomyces sp. DSM 44938]
MPASLSATVSPAANVTTGAATGRPLRLAVITGSVREGRFGPTVARWFAERAAARPDLTVDVVDLAGSDAELPLHMAAPGPGGAALTARLDAADAFVVITPEYNHSYPAGLKNVIDWHREEWHAKPIGFVSYGGLSGGLRAVEHLRVVFAELHAVTVRDTVSFHLVWNQFDDQGRLAEPAGPEGAATAMLDQLAWWGDALRAARSTRPFAA